VPAGLRLDEPASIAELATTLADLAGAGGLPGRSLARLWRELGRGSAPEPLYAETLAPRLDFGWSELRAWRSGRYKYVRAPRVELYDLEADPAEGSNIAADRPALTERLERELQAALARMGEAESHRAPDSAAAERLRSLGYVQGPGGRGSGADPKDRLDVARRIARATGPFANADEVVAEYRAISRLDPENPLVNMRLADALLRGGRPADAIPIFRRVVSGGPRSADPFVGLATACAQTGRLEESKDALERALEVDPSSGQAQFNLGELARTRGDRTGARARFEAARRDPLTRERAEARLAELRTSP
jgi:predicted Zn-dependent protease